MINLKCFTILLILCTIGHNLVLQKGTEFFVDPSSYADDDRPQVAVLKNGNFIVSHLLPSWSNLDLMVTIFDPDGKNISNFIVHDDIAPAKESPRVTVLTNGNFMIVWSQGTSSIDDIFASIFLPNGTNITNAFKVNDDFYSFKSNQICESLPNGNVVVAWYSGLNSFSSLNAKIFDQNGNVITNQFYIPDSMRGNSRIIRMKANADGKFMIIWEYNSDTKTNLYGRLFNIDGSPITSDILINAPLESVSYSNINCFPNGNFYVFYGSYVNQTRIISGQIFSSNGVKIGNLFRLDEFKGFHMQYSQMLSLPDGRMIFTSAKSPENTEQIYTQIYKTDLTPALPMFLAGNDGFMSQYPDSMALLSNDKYIIIWRQSGRYGYPKNIKGNIFTLVEGCENSNHYYFNSNGSCSPTCPAKGYNSSSFDGSLFCNFKCLPSFYYYFYNDSCYTTCDTTKKFLTNNEYCDFICPKDIFHYDKNNSCLPSCDTGKYFSIAESNYFFCKLKCPRDKNISSYISLSYYKSYTLIMNNVNRSHPYDRELVLSATILLNHPCSEIDPMLNTTFIWTCKINNVPCNDPDSLFGVIQNVSNITLSTDYFQNGNNMEFYVTSNRLKNITSTSGYLNITGLDTPVIQFSCGGSPCPSKYNQNSELYIEAKTDTGLSNVATWNISLPVNYIASNSKLFIKEISPMYSKLYMKIEVSLIENSNTVKAFMILPFNNAPFDGTIQVSPSTISSLSTSVNIEAIGWIDYDLPLSYQYFYESEILKPLSKVRSVALFTTLLPTVDKVIAYVYDSNFCFTRAEQPIVVNYVSRDINALANLNLPYDPSNNFENIAYKNSIMIEMQKYLESVCETGSLQLNSEELHQSQILESLALSYGKIGNAQTLSDSIQFFKESVIENFKIMSEFPLCFNSKLKNQTISFINSVVTLNNPTSFLSDNQLKQIGDILNNLYLYTVVNDCTCKSISCKEMKNVTLDLLKKFSNVAFRRRMPSQSPLIISTDTFDLIATKVRFCDLNDYTLNFTESETHAKIRTKTSSKNCTQTVNLIAYAFSSNQMTCSNLDEVRFEKDLITLHAVDSDSGAVMLDQIIAEIKVKSPLECPKTCQYSSSCICNGEILKLETRIEEVFFEKIFAVEDLGTTAFWVYEGILILFCITFSLVFDLKAVNQKSCEVDLKEEKNISLVRGVGLMYMVSNEILAIFALDHEEDIKRNRFIIYYFRIYFYAFYSGLFAPKGYYELTINVVLMPFVIFMIASRVINLVLIKIEKRRINNQLKYLITGLFIFITIACQYGLYHQCLAIGGRGQGPWLYIFGINILEEIAIIPFVYIGFQKGLIELRKQFPKKKFIFAINFVIDEDINQISNRIKFKLAKVYPMKTMDHNPKRGEFEESYANQEVSKSQILIPKNNTKIFNEKRNTITNDDDDQQFIEEVRNKLRTEPNPFI